MRNRGVRGRIRSERETQREERIREVVLLPPLVSSAARFFEPFGAGKEQSLFLSGRNIGLF